MRGSCLPQSLTDNLIWQMQRARVWQVSICLNFSESMITDAQEVRDSAGRPVFAHLPLYQSED